MKQGALYIGFTLLVSVFLVKFFSPMYNRTQKIKMAQKPYEEINLEAIKNISKSMENLIVIPAKAEIQELSFQELEKRTNKLLLLKSQLPKAHELYTTRCFSCHGSLGEGGKALYSFDTRLTHRNTSYQVPPLKKNKSWNTDLHTFFVSASKQNKPHLPQALQTLEENDLTQLKNYLSQLVE